MTQDEIIQMAKEANIWIASGWKKHGTTIDELVRFAKVVAQHEREVCARVCDDINAKYKWPEDTAERVASQWCADSIRARGQA